MPLSVFLELSKAFDTLDHSILLLKLTHYGLSQAAIRWFSSYLLGRRQLVDFNGTWSTLTSTSTGVPQGSILGPLLFIIYMNDIHVASDKFNAIIYADDTSLLSSLCSFNVSVQRNTTSIAELSSHINLELGNIQEWLNINKLSLNVQKTKFMIFHNYQRDISLFIPEIKINGQLVERVTELNFLSLTIDEHLNWKSHIQKVSNKVSRSIGVLNILKKFLPITILRILYNALILPHCVFFSVAIIINVIAIFLTWILLLSLKVTYIIVIIIVIIIIIIIITIIIIIIIVIIISHCCYHCFFFELIQMLCIGFLLNLEWSDWPPP